MVIKTVQMGIPILISRSGFTAWGVDLARQAGLTLIGRAKGKRFVALAGSERIVFDGDLRVRRGRASAPRAQSEPRGGRGVKIVGLLLAGGQSRRMGGGDKALRLLGGIPLLERVIERMRPQVETLVLNANGDPARFASFGLPVVPDSVPDYAGPLAGVLAGLDWTAAQPPGLPARRQRRHRRAVSAARSRVRLVRGMEEAGADLACAASGGQPHPVFGLWPVRLREDLRHALVDEGDPQGRCLDRAPPPRDRALRRASR